MPSTWGNTSHSAGVYKLEQFSGGHLSNRYQAPSSASWTMLGE